MAVKQNNMLATAFHPELTSDLRWYGFPLLTSVNWDFFLMSKLLIFFFFFSFSVVSPLSFDCCFGI